MSNPFKAGDKLVCIIGGEPGTDAHYTGQLVTVAGINGDLVRCVEKYQSGNTPLTGNYHWRYRAAIKGRDYDVLAQDPLGIVQQVQPSGHASDGSSVQKHSCGGLYPYVLVYRDKKHGRNADGRYDVGVIGPQNQEPLWFKSMDHAVAVAEAMKGNEA